MSKLTSDKLDSTTLYNQLSQNLRASDEISFKLLGLVPLATLLSFVAVLVQEKTIDWSPVFYLFGGLGAILVWGIFRWELRNIQRCIWYCELMDKMEAEVDKNIPKWKGKYPRPKFLRWSIGKTESEKIIYFVLIMAWLIFPLLVKALKDVVVFNGIDIVYFLFFIMVIIATLISCFTKLKE